MVQVGEAEYSGGHPVSKYTVSAKTIEGETDYELTDQTPPLLVTILVRAPPPFAAVTLTQPRATPVAAGRRPALPQPLLPACPTPCERALLRTAPTPAQTPQLAQTMPARSSPDQHGETQLSLSQPTKHGAP